MNLRHVPDIHVYRDPMPPAPLFVAIDNDLIRALFGHTPWAAPDPADRRDMTEASESP